VVAPAREAYADVVLARLLAYERPRPPSPRRLGLIVVTIAAALGGATAVVAALESSAVGLADASPVYFVAIVLVGSLIGTWPALVTSLVAFLVYDLLFTEPRLTLAVDDPREWLDLVVFLVLAVVVGRLSALGSERAAEASRRATESTDLFAISRLLATAPDVDAAAIEVARRLLETGSFDRVWVVRDRTAGPRVLADTGGGAALPASAIVTSLVRMPGDTPAHWLRSHEPASRDAGARRSGSPIVRVRMEADGVAVGALKATLRPGRTEPDRTSTRLLALAADQLALAIRRDDLRREATEVEIARRADALKSALLDAVSHDLRTPLASIRAAAGSLVDPDVAVDEGTARSTAAAIDSEADRLDRLVREVLDLSRIEAGALRLDPESLDLADAVEAVVQRLRAGLGDRPIEIAIPATVPPVRADAVLLDGLLTNLVDNVARHAPVPAPLRISAEASTPGRIAVQIDDGGPGLPDAARGRLFEKFQPLPSRTAGSRPGLGLGLAIVRGMTEAMGGSVVASQSPLGGLRVTVELPAATSPEESGRGATVTEQPNAASATAAGRR
jgi:two-component system, OmpR family, sensor histidine kinase KdpD